MQGYFMQTYIQEFFRRCSKRINGTENTPLIPSPPTSDVITDISPHLSLETRAVVDYRFLIHYDTDTTGQPLYKV
jgi:hypothetical protein